MRLSKLTAELERDPTYLDCYPARPMSDNAESSEKAGIYTSLNGRPTPFFSDVDGMSEQMHRADRVRRAQAGKTRTSRKMLAVMFSVVDWIVRVCCCTT